jgi:hypothetical protein
MKKIILALFALSLLLLAGCYTKPNMDYREFVIKKDYDKVWDVTLAALKETYTIEAQDKEKGVITTQTVLMNGWQISQISDLFFPAYMSFELRGHHSVTANLTRISSFETSLRITPTMEWWAEKVYVMKPEEKFYQDLYEKINTISNSELLKEIKELAAAIKN